MILLLFLSVQLYCSSFGSGGETAPPPRQPPDAILEELTQGHQIPLEYYYVDDSNKGQGTHYKYSYADITALIDQCRLFIRKAQSVPLPAPPSSLPPSSSWLTQLTDLWLVHALTKYPITGREAVVFGSTSPWYESMALALGAGHVTVVEYNHLTYDHPNISTVLVKDMEKDQHLFDIAISLSSFDHDGLGRYGDPIHPSADIHAMQTTRDLLKPGGLLFLTVPIGPDVVVWNLHRRYGRLRLPRLLEGWEVLERVGWSEDLVDQQSHFTLAYEPVLILRKPTGSE